MNKRPDLDVAAIVTDELRRSDEKVNWPLKVLSDILDRDEMVDLLVDLLEDCDTGYQRNPEKKQELILRAMDLKDRRLAEQVVRFLEDDNETIRFLAVDAALKEGYDDIVIEPLSRRLAEEDSLSIVQKLTEAFVERPEWKIPEELREDVEAALPDEYAVHKEGHVYRRRS